jgi:hypothetical protein
MDVGETETGTGTANSRLRVTNGGRLGFARSYSALLSLPENEIPRLAEVITAPQPIFGNHLPVQPHYPNTVIPTILDTPALSPLSSFNLTSVKMEQGRKEGARESKQTGSYLQITNHKLDALA